MANAKNEYTDTHTHRDREYQWLRAMDGKQKKKTKQRITSLQSDTELNAKGKHTHIVAHIRKNEKSRKRAEKKHTYVK